MATKNTTGKTAYMYDDATSTWYAIAGTTNTAANYEWSGTQDFLNTVTVEDALTAQAGVNNYLDPSARDTALPTPVRGTVAFVKQDASANRIDELQYYDGTTWKYLHGYTTLVAKVANHTLDLVNIGKTITMDSSSDTTVTVPPNSSSPFPVGSRLDVVRLGTGAVTFVQDTGVTINSKNGNKKIASRYSGATIFKVDTNTWVLIGDLTA